jgi:hypothetical protein
LALFVADQRDDLQRVVGPAEASWRLASQLHCIWSEPACLHPCWSCCTNQWCSAGFNFGVWSWAWAVDVASATERGPEALGEHGRSAIEHQCKDEQLGWSMSESLEMFGVHADIWQAKELSESKVIYLWESAM